MKKLSLSTIATIISIPSTLILILKGIAELVTNKAYLAFFRDFGGWVWIVCGVLILAAIVGFWVASRRSKYDFRIKKTHCKVEILDEMGKVAVVVKEVGLEFLRKNVQTHIDHMSTDGQIIEESSTPGGIKEVKREFGGKYRFISRFDQVYPKGSNKTIVFRCKMIDSFLEKDEFWSLEPFYPTDEYVLEIRLPRSRPATSAHSYLISPLSISEGEASGRLPNPTLSDGNTKIEFIIKKPKMSERVKIEWTW